MPAFVSNNIDLDLAGRRIGEALSILHAIDEGQLLGDCPPSRDARMRHQAAVALIDVLREKLESFKAEVEAPVGLAFGTETPALAAEAKALRPEGGC